MGVLNLCAFAPSFGVNQFEGCSGVPENDVGDGCFERVFNSDCAVYYLYALKDIVLRTGVVVAFDNDSVTIALDFRSIANHPRVLFVL